MLEVAEGHSSIRILNHCSVCALFSIFLHRLTSAKINFFFTANPPENIKYSPRDQLLDDLRHSELAYNFHNPNAIDDRNRKAEVERTRKKVELQQELIRQIEEKKLQMERLRAKEKEEEDILQR